MTISNDRARGIVATIIENVRRLGGYLSDRGTIVEIELYELGERITIYGFTGENANLPLNETIVSLAGNASREEFIAALRAVGGENFRQRSNASAFSFQVFTNGSDWAC